MQRFPLESCPQYISTISPLGLSGDSVLGIPICFTPTSINIEVPDVKVRVTKLFSTVAVSSAALLATFKKTSSRVVRPSCMSAIPNSLSLYCSSSISAPSRWQ